MAPRRRRRFLAERDADAGLCLVPEQRQVHVEDVLGPVGIALGVLGADLDQHFGIGKAGHGAVGAAGQLLRQIEPAIADEDRNLAAGQGAQAS